MGCWMSTRKPKAPKNTTFDGAYVAVTPPTKGLSRRLWKNRNSYASSSGVSSAYSSKASNSHCSSPETVPDTPIKKQRSSQNDLYENLPAFLRNIPLDIEQDDEDEQKFFNGLEMLATSRGYYSEESSSDCSTPLTPGLKHTQSGGESSFNSSTSECELDMEMRMMNKAFGIMPKTSSPTLQRRDITFDMQATRTSSSSYEKWQKYLQMTPTYALHNITRIPEAIAGRFCPASFPAYTDVQSLKKEFYNYPRREEFEAETIIIEHPSPKTIVCTEL